MMGGLPPVTGRPADVAALLAPEDVLGDPGLLAVDSADGPGQRALPSAALVTAGDANSTRSQIESAWSSANPGGRAERDADGVTLYLWNFDVASAVLKTEHLNALSQFTDVRRLAGARPVIGAATGYASRTGRAEVNDELGWRRAAAVAEWCDANGLRGVAIVNGGEQDGNDGESYARARCVRLWFENPAPPVPEPPAWSLLPPTDSAPPAAFRCDGVSATAEVVVGPLDLFTLPPGGYLQGRFSFNGKVKLTYSDPDACRLAAISVNAVNGSAWVKYQARVTEELAARLSVSQDWDGKLTVALTGIVGDGVWKWELGTQLDPEANFIVLKSPDFPFVELSRTTIDGRDVTLQVAGQITFAGRPGDRILVPVSEWAAARWAVIGEAAIWTGYLAFVAVLFYLMLDASANADAEGLRIAGLFAQRLGFGAQLAVFVANKATDRDADIYVSGYDTPGLREMRDLIQRSRRKAFDQLAALGDRQEQRIAELRAAYGVDSSGAPMSYELVAYKLIDALGGPSRTGGPPTLDQL